MDSSDHTSEEYCGVFTQYFEDLHLEQFEDVMLQQSERHFYPIYIDAVVLLNHNVKVGFLLLTNPGLLIPLAERSAISTQENMLRKITGAADTSAFALKQAQSDYTVKRNVKVRVTNLPLTDDFCKRSITALRTEDVGHLISVRGIVIREGSVRMFEASREYACEMCHGSDAGRKTVEAMSPAHGPGVVQRPPPCSGCGKVMMPVPTNQSDVASCLRDYQEIRLQDQVTNLSAGTIPRSITVILEDDLVEWCKAGDDLIVVGVLTRRWHREPRQDQRCSIELVLHANHLVVTNESKTASTLSPEDVEQFTAFWKQHEGDRLRGRDILVGSVCPQVFGMHAVKLSLLLVVIGGHTLECEGNSRTRGDCHMLLVGDPGTGKSQFLQFAAKLSSRSVMTTGIGSTSAGLTASAYKEGDHWVLDAGALVIADGGVCCIDEFSTIPEAKHVAIHEAMEQQTVNVAKAGLITTLNTRCSVIAACNPKKDQSTVEGEAAIGIATPLLSRFDLVIVLMDNRTGEWDEKLARFLLQRACEKPYNPDTNSKRPRVTPSSTQLEEETPDADAGGGVGGGAPHWDTQTLRSYVEWVRSKKGDGLPPMEPAAMALLERYYNWQRENRSRLNQSRRTVRMLESLIRLSQAHSLLLAKSEVTLEDAVVAVTLMDLTCGEHGNTSDPPLQSLPSPDPARAVNNSLAKLMDRLGLGNHVAFDHVQRLSPVEAETPGNLAMDSRYAFPQEADDSMAALFASRRARMPTTTVRAGNTSATATSASSSSSSSSSSPAATATPRQPRVLQVPDTAPTQLDLSQASLASQPVVVPSLVSSAPATPQSAVRRNVEAASPAVPGSVYERFVMTPDVREAPPTGGISQGSFGDDDFGLDLDLDSPPSSPFRPLSLPPPPSGNPSQAAPQLSAPPPPAPAPPPAAAGGSAAPGITTSQTGQPMSWAALDVNAVHPDRGSGGGGGGGASQQSGGGDDKEGDPPSTPPGPKKRRRLGNVNRIVRAKALPKRTEGA